MSGPILSFLVAMTRNRVIGRSGAVPWRVPADLRHFRATTLGKPIIMGRKTFDSIGRVLKKRSSYIVSRDPSFTVPGAKVYAALDSALDAALDEAKEQETGEAVVIGGAEIFRQAMPRADRIYLTLLAADLPGDTFFPEIDRDFRKVECTTFPFEEQASHAADLIILERASQEQGALEC